MTSVEGHYNGRNTIWSRNWYKPTKLSNPLMVDAELSQKLTEKLKKLSENFQKVSEFF